MSFSRGDVVLLPIPFTDLTSRKVRPAVVIGGSPRTNDLFLGPISSQLKNTGISLEDWAAAGLNAPCGVKAQLATVESRLVLKTVGRLSAKDHAQMERQLRVWLGL